MLSSSSSPPSSDHHFYSSPTMTKTLNRNKPFSSSSSLVSNLIRFLGGATVAFLVVWTLFSTIDTSKPNFTPRFSNGDSKSSVDDDSLDFDLGVHGINLKEEPESENFYDDPNLSYSMEKPIKNWDQKRKDWLNQHPSFASGVNERILLVTGSQMKPCKHPSGDSMLLRFFKNKVDYCRIHGYDIFYNNALFQPKMTGCWAKLPLVRAAMIAHPETEWIWWVDSDAAFTDMEFKIPLERYTNKNFILHGWNKEVFEVHSWVGLNAGIFLIRNCQWSLDFMDAWSNMGPLSPDYDKWGKILKSSLRDKVYDDADDQSSLVYLMLKEKSKWADKIYLEQKYYFEGYFLEVLSRFDNITKEYLEVEQAVSKLRRRHAEKVTEHYADLREPYITKLGNGYQSLRKPFITHFAGCQPCSGLHNASYSDDGCWKGMEKALNFADNQVLRNFGLIRRDLMDPSSLTSMEFDEASG
ncbi:hypothetical protein MKW92_008009 [Papaver armeniacum]|nr:hypothetical protein MKW92_008009 [Papaver armeniacum]